jgi:hypothetical protein
MSKAGLSGARLKRLHDAASRAVETGEVAGAITLVQRRGETVVEVVGQMDRAAGTKLERGSPHRAAASTVRPTSRPCSSSSPPSMVNAAAPKALGDSKGTTQRTAMGRKRCLHHAGSTVRFPEQALCRLMARNPEGRSGPH